VRRGLGEDCLIRNVACCITEGLTVDGVLNFEGESVDIYDDSDHVLVSVATTQLLSALVYDCSMSPSSNAALSAEATFRAHLARCTRRYGE
jgi:hypothetical protein